MRLTRHARNRLRRIERVHPGATASQLLEALFGAEALGYDETGNRRVRVRVAGVLLTVVIDEAERVIITLWEE